MFHSPYWNSTLTGISDSNPSISKVFYKSNLITLLSYLNQAICCITPRKSALNSASVFSLIPCHYLLCSSLPFLSMPLRTIHSFAGSLPISLLFTSEGQSIRASASANTPSSEISGLISFRVDWVDFLAFQGTLKSLLQYTIQKHQFFKAQPSLCSNYWKNHSFDYTDLCQQTDIFSF